MCSIFSKRLIVLATVAVVALSCLLLCVPTAHAAVYEYENVTFVTDIRSVFPLISYSNDYNSACFYSDSFYSGYANAMFGLTYGDSSWSYIGADVTNSMPSCRSLILSLYLNSTFSFDISNTYIFDFTVKCLNYTICDTQKLNYVSFGPTHFDLTDLKFEPQSVWTSGGHSFAHFYFAVPGNYLSSEGLGYRFCSFFFSFDKGASSEAKIWLDPDSGFSFRPMTSEEASAELTGQATADAIGNIGSDIELPDTSGTLNNAGDIMSKLDVEKDYKIDPNESAELLDDSSALFKQSDFTNAFGFIDNCVQRFVDSSDAMYMFFLSILGLGVAFAALGRSL